MTPNLLKRMVELTGIEPVTSCMPCVGMNHAKTPKARSYIEYAQNIIVAFKAKKNQKYPIKIVFGKNLRAIYAPLTLSACLIYPWIACANDVEKPDHYNATKSSLSVRVKRIKRADSLAREKGLLDCLKKATEGSVKPCEENKQGGDN